MLPIHTRVARKHPLGIKGLNPRVNSDFRATQPDRFTQHYNMGVTVVKLALPTTSPVLMGTANWNDVINTEFNYSDRAGLDIILDDLGCVYKSPDFNGELHPNVARPLFDTTATRLGFPSGPQLLEDLASIGVKVLPQLISMMVFYTQYYIQARLLAATFPVDTSGSLNLLELLPSSLELVDRRLYRILVSQKQLVGSHWQRISNLNDAYLQEAYDELCLATTENCKQLEVGCRF